MKMFNKVVAPFAGTVEQVLVEGDGVIIAKGQPLFKVTPDEKVEVLSDIDLAALRKDHTTELVKLFI
jgi:multidrug resistance efflux pump